MRGAGDLFPCTGLGKGLFNGLTPGGDFAPCAFPILRKKRPEDRAAVYPGSKPGREQRPLDSGREKGLLPLFIELLHPAIISHIAHFIPAEGKKDIRPRLLITGGESLVPFRRQLIEKSFGKRVYDIYGSHEFNVLAWECPVTGEYHICDDNVIVEILRNGHPAEIGERGEVVATGLHSYSMPFIRYRLGDVVTKGHEVCPCGHPFSTLKAIQGRMHDYFRMPDGSYMHPDEIVVPIMENESGWFDRYQLVQESENLIVLKVKPFSTPHEEQLQHVRNLAEERLPAGVEFRIHLVRTLSSEGSGKFRFCKSKVSSDCEGIDWDNL